MEGSSSGTLQLFLVDLSSPTVSPAPQAVVSITRTHVYFIVHLPKTRVSFHCTCRPHNSHFLPPRRAQSLYPI